MAREARPESQVSVGKRLELIRAALDWENKFLASQIGLTPQKWNNYKNGSHMFPIEFAARLCVTGGVTMDFIYRGERGALSQVFMTKLAKAEEKLARDGESPSDAERPTKKARLKRG